MEKFGSGIRDKHPRSVTLVIIKYIFKFSFSSRDPLALERAARQYRNAAAVHEASCTWSGQLPPRLPSGFNIYAGIFISLKKCAFFGNFRQLSATVGYGGSRMIVKYIVCRVRSISNGAGLCVLNRRLFDAEYPQMLYVK
jgi:hypothetical protein